MRRASQYDEYGRYRKANTAPDPVMFTDPKRVPVPAHIKVKMTPEDRAQELLSRCLTRFTISPESARMLTERR